MHTNLIGGESIVCKVIFIICCRPREEVSSLDWLWSALQEWQCLWGSQKWRYKVMAEESLCGKTTSFEVLPKKLVKLKCAVRYRQRATVKTEKCSQWQDYKDKKASDHTDHGLVNPLPRDVPIATWTDETWPLPSHCFLNAIDVAMWVSILISLKKLNGHTHAFLSYMLLLLPGEL